MSVAEQYANVIVASATLVGTITSGATSLTVSDAAQFPPSPQFRIIIDTEILLVTAVAGAVFTVTRGAEGSTAAAHTAGAAVVHELTRDGLKGIGGSVNLEGTFASRPAAGTVGRLYLPTDGLWLARDDGTAWKGYGPALPLTEPVDPGTWVNQGSTTLTSTSGGLYIVTAGTATEGVHLRVKTAPSPPWTLTMGFLPMQMFLDFSSVGLCIRESGTGEIILLALTSNTFYQSGGGTQTRKGIIVDKWSSATVGVATYTSTPPGIFGPDWQVGPCMWFRISDNNTNLIYSISNDGVNFIPILTTTRTDFLTADQYGFFVRAFTVTQDAGMMVVSLKES